MADEEAVEQTAADEARAAFNEAQAHADELREAAEEAERAEAE